jgi:hypothetical protein
MATWGRMGRILAMAMLVLGVRPAVSWGQSEPSLGDVARQKPVRKARKVYTNDDFPQRAPQSASSDVAKGPASAQRDKAPEDVDEQENAKASASDSGVPDQKLKAARSRVEALRQTEERQRKFYNQLREKLAEEDTPFRQQVMQEELRHADENMSAVRQQRENAEKQFSALEAAAAEKQNDKQKKSAAPLDTGAAAQ